MQHFWASMILQTEYLRVGVQCQGQGASSTPSKSSKIISTKGGGVLEKNSNLDEKFIFLENRVPHCSRMAEGQGSKVVEAFSWRREHICFQSQIQNWEGGCD